MTKTKENIATNSDIFKTIKIGTHNSVKSLISDIKNEGNKVSSWAKDVMKHDDFKLSSECKEINLILKTVSDLGFEDGAKYDDIIQRAKELGFDLCSPEVAPKLRLAYTDQPKGHVLIVHEPITDLMGCIRLLRVSRDSDGNCCLSAYGGELERHWDSARQLVFACRK